jgi:hypothetical protein
MEGKGGVCLRFLRGMGRTGLGVSGAVFTELAWKSSIDIGSKFIPFHFIALGRYCLTITLFLNQKFE